MSDGFGSAANPFVENPYTGLLKEVQWPRPSGFSFSIIWTARLTGHPNPLYEPGFLVMDVSVSGVPALRSPLKVGGDPPIVPVIYDDSDFAEFPDGTGTLTAWYQCGFGPIPVGGGVQYVTTASGAERFGGAASVSISIGISLLEIFRGTGYDWIASAGASGAPGVDLFGFAGSAGTISLNATITLDPPTLSFTGA